MRMTISLDTLHRDRFETITRSKGFERIRGPEGRRAAGLAPVKVNTVVIPRVNDDEIPDLSVSLGSRTSEVRFIELMPTASSARSARSWGAGGRHSSSGGPGPNTPGPSGRWSRPGRRRRGERLSPEGQARLGSITPVSDPSAGVRRLRLGPDGRLRVCLFDEGGSILARPARWRGRTRRTEALLGQLSEGRRRGSAGRSSAFRATCSELEGQLEGRSHCQR